MFPALVAQATATPTPIPDGVSGADMAYYLSFYSGLDLFVALGLAVILVGSLLLLLRRLAR